MGCFIPLSLLLLRLCTVLIFFVVVLKIWGFFVFQLSSDGGGLNLPIIGRLIVGVIQKKIFRELAITAVRVQTRGVLKNSVWRGGGWEGKKIQRQFICLFYYSNVIFNKNKFLKNVCSPPWIFLSGKSGAFCLFHTVKLVIYLFIEIFLHDKTFAGVILSPVLHGRGAGIRGGGVFSVRHLLLWLFTYTQKSNGNLKILFVENAHLKKENLKKLVLPRLKRLLFSVGKIAHWRKKLKHVDNSTINLYTYYLLLFLWVF